MIEMLAVVVLLKVVVALTFRPVHFIGTVLSFHIFISRCRYYFFKIVSIAVYTCITDHR